MCSPCNIQASYMYEDQEFFCGPRVIQKMNDIQIQTCTHSFFINVYENNETELQTYRKDTLRLSHPLTSPFLYCLPKSLPSRIQRTREKKGGECVDVSKTARSSVQTLPD